MATHRRTGKAIATPVKATPNVPLTGKSIAMPDTRPYTHLLTLHHNLAWRMKKVLQPDGSIDLVRHYRPSKEDIDIRCYSVEQAIHHAFATLGEYHYTIRSLVDETIPPIIGQTFKGTPPTKQSNRQAGDTSAHRKSKAKLHHSSGESDSNRFHETSNIKGSVSLDTHHIVRSRKGRTIKRKPLKVQFRRDLSYIPITHPAKQLCRICLAAKGITIYHLEEYSEMVPSSLYGDSYAFKSDIMKRDYAHATIKSGTRAKGIHKGRLLQGIVRFESLPKDYENHVLSGEIASMTLANTAMHNRVPGEQRIDRLVLEAKARYYCERHTLRLRAYVDMAIYRRIAVRVTVKTFDAFLRSTL